MSRNLIPLYLFCNNESELYFELFLFSFFKISEIQGTNQKTYNSMVLKIKQNRTIVLNFTETMYSFFMENNEIAHETIRHHYAVLETLIT